MIDDDEFREVSRLMSGVLGMVLGALFAGILIAGGLAVYEFLIR